MTLVLTTMNELPVIFECTKFTGVWTWTGPVTDAFCFALGLLDAALGLLGKPLLYMVLRSGLVALSLSGTALKGLEAWATGLACRARGLGWGCIDTWLPAQTRTHTKH